MPAILGLSRYRTPLGIYLDKIGEGPEDNPSIPMRAGTFLEPFLAELYEEETGQTIIGLQERVANPDRPIFLATLDARCASGRVVEFKSVETAEGLGEAGTDEVREDWIVQAHHQMLAAVVDVVDFGVLVGKREFRPYSVRRSEALVIHIVNKGLEFWDRIVSRNPPEPSLPADARNISRLYKPDGSEVALDGFECLLADEFEAARIAKSQAQQAYDITKAKLEQVMGNHSIGLLPDGRRIKVTKSEIKERTQAIKAHTQTRVSILKAKD